MNLSKGMNKLLIDELNFALQSMKTTDNPTEKLYFFSAIYGVANRIFNIEFDSELVFIHNVVLASYSTINTNLTAISQGQGSALGIPNKLFDGIENAIEELIEKISKKQEIYPVLQKISELSYITTGNGRYLHLKGMLIV